MIEDKIKNAAQAYYSGSEIMSDQEFDQLVEQLREENPESELLSTPGWGATVPGDRETVKHLNFSGSLDKTTKMVEGVMTPKMDGISVNAVYENGTLKHIATRNDGTQGLVCTDLIPSVPRTIPIKELVEIRGEAVIFKGDWEGNEKFQDYTFVRNATAGLVNRKSPIDLNDFVQVVFFALNGQPLNTENSTLPSSFKVAQVLDAPMGFGWYEDQMYCDGTVIQGEDGLIAYKDQDSLDHKIFTVKEIIWQESSHQRLKPVLSLEGQILDGANIQRCTGFNYETVKNLEIGTGARIVLRRSGGVIPHWTQEVVEPGVFVEPENLAYVKGVDAYSSAGGEEFNRLRAIQTILDEIRPKGTRTEVIQTILERFTPKEIFDGTFEIEDLSENMAGRVGVMSDLMRSKELTKAHLINLSNIDGVGYNSAVAYLEGNSSPRKIELIESSQTYQWLLETYPRIVDQEQDEELEDSLTPVCMTGKVPGMTKAEYAKKHGLRIVPLKDAAYLLCDNLESTSSKAKQARSKGIELRAYKS